MTLHTPQLAALRPAPDCCPSGRDKVCTECREGIHSGCINNARRLIPCVATGIPTNPCRCASIQHDPTPEGAPTR